MLTAEEIEAAVLELPENEFASLVDRLVQLAAVRTISPAVLNSAERRLDDIYVGRAPTITFEDLLSELERA